MKLYFESNKDDDDDGSDYNGYVILVKLPPPANTVDDSDWDDLDDTNFEG